jgi:hypothetical protein
LKVTDVLKKINLYLTVAIKKNNLGQKGLNIFEHLSNEILLPPKQLPYSIKIISIFFGNLHRRDKAEC